VFFEIGFRDDGASTALNVAAGAQARRDEFLGVFPNTRHERSGDSRDSSDSADMRLDAFIGRRTGRTRDRLTSVRVHRARTTANLSSSPARAARSAQSIVMILRQLRGRTKRGREPGTTVVSVDGNLPAARRPADVFELRPTSSGAASGSSHNPR